MKKRRITLFLIFIICIVGMFSIYPKLNMKAQTVDEIQAEIDKIETDISAAKAKAQELSTNITAIGEQLKLTQENIATTNTQITTTNTEIKTTEADIISKEDEIVIKEEEAEIMEGDGGNSLRAIQSMSHQNFIVNSIFASESEDIADIFSTFKALNTLSESIVDSLNELITLLEDIKIDKANLEKTKVALVAKKDQLEVTSKELELQEVYNKELKIQASSALANVQDSAVDSGKSLQVQKDTLNILTDAGCTGSDVYGVDCGVDDVVNPSSGFIRPVESGQISNEFGGAELGGNGYGHTGIDIANTCGTAVYPAANGIVTSVDRGSTIGGPYVTIMHLVNGKNYTTYYGHLSAQFVNTGDKVTTGTRIGNIGDIGLGVTGCHLHFEMNYGTMWAWAANNTGLFFNPRQMVSFPEIWQWYSGR